MNTHAYLLKVYQTLSIGLLVTCIGTLTPTIPWTICVPLSFITTLLIASSEQMSFFMIFCALQGNLVGSLCIPNEVVVTAMPTTFAIVISVTWVAFISPSSDIPTAGATSFLGSILSVLMLMALANFYFQSEVVVLIDACVGAILFTLYLFLDTFKIVWEYEASGGVETVVWHAMGVYIDVINLFVRLVILIMKSSSKKKE